MGDELTLPGTYSIDDVRFARTNRQNVVESLEAFFRLRPTNNYVCVSNAHTTVECLSNPRLARIQNGAFLNIADGQPLVLYAKLSGAHDVERIMGPDLMSAVFSAPAARGRRHYFLGGTPETLRAMDHNLRSKFPELVVVGMHSPPFRPLSAAETDALLKQIAEAQPDYLWICFGAPKQEYWMADHHARVPGALLVGVGAAFAYHAGELKRAPVLFQKLSLEWVWRLAQDPKRLWKRYLRTNPVFAKMLLERALIRLVLRR